MKTELEQQDIQAIAQRVMELLKPVLSGNGKKASEDTIFDVPGLVKYLKVSKKWIYERTHLKEIPYLKVGGQLRFRKRDIENWLNTFKVPAVSTLNKGTLKAIKR